MKKNDAEMVKVSPRRFSRFCHSHPILPCARSILKIYAANVIRDKKQAVNFMRLSSRIDAVAARVETAIRMNALSKQIGQVVRGMDSVLASMDAEKVRRPPATGAVRTCIEDFYTTLDLCSQITSMMDQFEKQFDNLDVRSSVMGDAIESSTASSIPEQVCFLLLSLCRLLRDTV
jgi:charged multivesicular body protein 1